MITQEVSKNERESRSNHAQSERDSRPRLFSNVQPILQFCHHHTTTILTMLPLDGTTEASNQSFCSIHCTTSGQPLDGFVIPKKTRRKVRLLLFVWVLMCG
jgi:hypothetical protein